MPAASSSRATRRERLVAHGAVGDEQRGVGAIGAAARDELGAVDLERGALAAIGRRAVEARGQRADAPGNGRAPQRRQREPRAAVFHRRVLAVDRHVRDAQVVVRRGVARVHAIELRRRVVRRARALVALVRLVRRGGGDQRNACSRERHAQGHEGHVRVVRPFVRCAVAERRVVRARALQVRNRRVVRRCETEVGFGRHGRRPLEKLRAPRRSSAAARRAQVPRASYRESCSVDIALAVRRRRPAQRSCSSARARRSRSPGSTSETARYSRPRPAQRATPKPRTVCRATSASRGVVARHMKTSTRWLRMR